MTEAGPITESVVRHLVILANADGEYRLNAGGWTGALLLGAGDHQWQIDVRAGLMDEPVPGWPDAGSTDTVTLSGQQAVWSQLVADPPAAPFTDVFGANLAGLEVKGDFGSADHHLAVRRLGDLIRSIVAGTDPGPKPMPALPRRHGLHDQAVGRYVHLDIDGVDYRVYYEEAGEGIPVLCQHTAGSDARQYRHLLEDRRLTTKFRFIAYDLPHHGKSVPPETTPWWTKPYLLTKPFAMAVPLALSDALGLDRPVFLGSSVGGMLALDLARYHPERFRAVIACEAGLSLGLDADRRPAEDSAASVGEDPAQHAASMMSWMGATAPEAYRQETRYHYSQGAPGVFPGDINYFGFEHDLRGEAHLIDTSICPVHLLTGEYDYVTIPVSEQAHREIAGSTYKLMSGMGHFPMSEDPERFIGYLLPILEEIADESLVDGVKEA
jgi:pimeloyl-ACP methyl ester carboxylesterase